MDPTDERATLERLAAAIADGERVDWQAIRTDLPQLRSRFDCLQTIESVAQLCQEAGDRAGNAAPAGGEAAAPGAAQSQEVRTWGHLIVHERLAAGSFGEVFRATDPVLQRQVALKLFHASPATNGSADLVAEARRLAQVRHPNVITVHGAELHAGRAGMWTELLGGETLEESLGARGPFSAAEAAVIGTELCAALAALHQHGLVHGDITTRNVMRADGGRIVLMDFGAVREETPAGAGATPRCGTPLVMAPEVLGGGRPTRAGDVYQLGVLLYRLVSGAYPVEAADLDTLVAKHRNRECVPLRDRRPDLPRQFVQVVERALEPELGRRFTSMGAMERALRSSQGAARRARSRRRVAAFSLLAGVAVALGFFAVGIDPSSVRVRTTLYRVHDGVAEPVDPLAGANLRGGDALFMTLESDDDLHVYVLNETASEPGVVNTLFPDPGLRLRNPLRGGRAHRLPAATTGEAFWEASPTGATEKILVVATRQRYDLLEDAIAHQFHDVAPATEVDPGRLEELRRRAIELRKSPLAEGSAIERLVERLEAQRQQGDLWYQIIPIEPEAAGPSTAER